MLNHQVFQAGNLFIHGASRNNAQRERDLNREAVLLRLLVRNTKQGKGRRSRLSFPFRFDSRQFGFLHVAHFVAGFITENNNGENRRHTEAGCDSEGALGESKVAAFEHIPGADGKNEHRAGHVA